MLILILIIIIGFIITEKKFKGFTKYFIKYSWNNTLSIISVILFWLFIIAVCELSYNIISYIIR